MNAPEAEIIDLPALAGQLPEAWRSRLLGQVGEARLKVARMDATPDARETHDYTEALLVLEGELRLRIAGASRTVRAGELCLIPAGVAHAVDQGSSGTLLIVDI